MPQTDKTRMGRFALAGILLALGPAVDCAGEDAARYSLGSWPAETFGNHRAVVRITQKADAVLAHIPWRRRDQHPELKNLIIVEAATGVRLKNVFPLEINREFWDILFQPSTVPGDYYIYYLPHVISGRANYPVVTYPKPESAAERDWLARHQLGSDSVPRDHAAQFPKAQLVEIQSVDAFNSFYPMEIIATAGEVESLLARHPGASYLLFPEDRTHPIRMTDDLPMKWILGEVPGVFRMEAERGEFHSFQIGIYACGGAIDDLSVHFYDLKSRKDGAIISADAFRCINLGGVDWTGKAFKKPCPVPQGKIQPLWIGIQIPRDASPGDYEGEITVSPRGKERQTLQLALSVSPRISADAGDNDPSRHSRLRWLDSTLALDDEVVSPYTPLKAEGNVIHCLGRQIRLGTDGFPQSIVSYFSPEMTRVESEGREILRSPITLQVQVVGGRGIPWKPGGVLIKPQAEGSVIWESRSAAGPLALECEANMEFDGNIEYALKLTASRETPVDDIRLEIPLKNEVARYMMGMGVKGGARLARSEWKWDPQKNQDSVWVGDVNAGIQCSFRDENYARPLNTNFYLSKPLNMPPSWYNEGKGGCVLSEPDFSTLLIRAYSGARTIRPGEILHFNFRLLLTPFRPIDTDAQWKTRFYHRFAPISEIAATGANAINIHHATEINPFINYPFLRAAEMKAYTDEAHAKGMKVKIYYTVRELSNHAPELFALRSLGDEILAYGPGGGFAWLQEHLGGEYIAGWFVPQLKDAAIINSGVSRWHNYYLEGLNWLVKNAGIDGLYIDDVAFDRVVMKRVRKILERGRPGSLIDLHSANQFNARDGFASSANLYLEHFPYLNRIWFGEYFDYNTPPDFWLVEMSGIPFGVMGEMLQDGGNPWRGMIYGMTSRLPWAGDPRPLWKVWDEFGIQGSRMIGYWAPACPVRTDNPEILATVYARRGKALVSLASWAREPVRCRLKVDWKQLGIDPLNARITAPEIINFQTSASFRPDGEIPVQPGKGWLLVIQKQP
jgi:hypothetical protein